MGRKALGAQRPLPTTTGRLAALVDGDLIGEPDIALAGVAPPDRARPGDLAFLASRRYLPCLKDTRASAVLLARDLRNEASVDVPQIVVTDPQHALMQVLKVFYPDRSPQWGVHPSARIGRGTRWGVRIGIGPHATVGRNVRCGNDCWIGPHAVVEDDAALGPGCVIEAHAVVHVGTVLGARVRVRTGARVGGTGFGFASTAAGLDRVPQVGGCRIGDDVEIGANTTVDRGTLAETEVGDGTKIDNLVQIAHNVRIGRRCIVMAQVGVAGSVVVGDEALLAGQAGLADHLTVGAGARIAAQSGVIGDIPAGATVSGYPARDHRSVLRQTATLERLVRIVSRLERLADRNDH